MNTNDTPVFTVFGGAYVPEHHNEACSFEADPRQHKFSDGPSWLVASTLVFALSICAAEIVYFTRLGSGLM